MTDLSLTHGAVGALDHGAIKGEDSSDEVKAVQFTSQGVLTSPELSQGDDGDASKLAEFTAELWLMSDLTPAPAAAQNVFCGPATPSGVRQWQLRVNTTGTISFVVRGAATTYTVTSSTVMATLGSTAFGASSEYIAYYHIVGAVEGAFVRLYINGVQEASTAWADAVPNNFTVGSATVIVGDVAGTVAYAYDELAFYRYGLTAAQIASHFDAGRNHGFLEQLPGVRINDVLDSAGSTAPRRIGTGARTITPVYMRGQSPLDEIQRATTAEAVDAALFTAADGTLVFVDSAHRSASPYNTVQATFGDGAGELPYVDVNVEYTDSFIVTEWNVTRDGSDAVTQTASDATSTSRYFSRPKNVAGLPLTVDADAATIATAMLAKYKDPMQRITRLTFSTLDAGVAEAIFRRELMDKITVKRTPPGGGSRISQDLFIQKIDVSGDNSGGPWTVVFGVSPL